MSTHKAYIHADAVVETQQVGEGTRIWRNVHVMPGAVIGKDCNIGEGCYIENHVIIGNGVTIKNNCAIWDNTTIEDDVFIGPAAVFTNDLQPRAIMKKGPDDLSAITIKKGATVGANATLLPGIVIHDYAFIGAGSVVTADVPAHHKIHGNPARFKGLVCRCAEPIPLGESAFHCKCGLSYTITGKTLIQVF